MRARAGSLFAVSALVLIVEGCAPEGDLDHGSVPGPAMMMIPSDDECGRSGERLDLLVRSELRCDCGSDPECVRDTTDCGPDAWCNPLRGNRCEGRVDLPRVNGECQEGTLRKTAAADSPCVALVPHECQTDSDCPIGARCDTLEGGVCTVGCLPESTCDDVPGTCCPAGQTCGCNGRCSEPPTSAPARLAVPTLSAAPASLDFTRPESGQPEPKAIGVRVRGASEGDEVLVVAARGLHVACAVPDSDEDYQQRCTLTLEAGASLQRVWVQPFEPGDAPADAHYEVDFRLKAGPYLVSDDTQVAAHDAPEPAAIPLTGHYEGELALAEASSLPEGATAMVVPDDGLRFNTRPIPLEAEVQYDDQDVPRLTVTFIDKAHRLSADGVLVVTYLADPAVEASDLVAVEGDVGRRFLPGGDGGDGPEITTEPMPTTRPPHFDAERGSLAGEIGLRLHGLAASPSPTPVVGYRFRLHRTGDLDTTGTLPPVPDFDPDAPQPPMEWAVGLRDALDPSSVIDATSPSSNAGFVAWLDLAQQGTVVSCGPGLVSGESAWEFACRRGLWQDVSGDAPADLSAGTWCTTALAAVEDIFDSSAPTYDWSIVPDLYVPCIAEEGHRFSCDSTRCTTAASPSVPIGTTTVSLGACRIDGDALDPAESSAPETYSEWSRAHRRACADRLLGFDPVLGAASSAGLHLGGSPLPTSGDLPLIDAAADVVLPRAFGLLHQGDRQALGLTDPEDEPTNAALATACANDFDRQPPAWTAVTPSAFAARLSQVFATSGCLSPANAFGSLAWLVHSDADPGDGKLFVRRMQQLTQTVRFAASFDAQEMGLGALLASQADALDDDLALQAASLDTPANRVTRLGRAAARVLHPSLMSHYASLPDATFETPDYRPTFESTAGGAAASPSASKRFTLFSDDLRLLGLALKDASEVAAGRGAVPPEEWRSKAGAIEDKSLVRLGKYAALFASIGAAAEVRESHDPTSPQSAAKPRAFGTPDDIAPLRGGMHLGDGFFALVAAGTKKESLPVYFVDPQGASSKFFATSDYVLDHWARPAVESAKQALAAARSSFRELLDRKLQLAQLWTGEIKTKDTMTSQLGSRIAALCGDPVDAGGYSAVWAKYDGKPEKAEPEAKCFLDVNKEVLLNGEAMTCDGVFARVFQATSPEDLQKCLDPAQAFKRNKQFRKLACTFAAFMADHRLRQNYFEYYRDAPCDGAYGSAIASCQESMSLADQPDTDIPDCVHAVRPAKYGERGWWVRDPTWQEYMPEWFSHHGDPTQEYGQVLNEPGTLPALLKKISDEIEYRNQFPYDFNSECEGSVWPHGDYESKEANHVGSDLSYLSARGLTEVDFHGTSWPSRLAKYHGDANLHFEGIQNS